MSYIDGFVVPVTTSRKQEYVDLATKMSKRYVEWGAIGYFECWADDVPDGKVTDFKRAVAAQADETVVFAWVLWPSKEARDAGNQKMMEDPEIEQWMQDAKNPPFNMQRMIFGGFTPLVEVGGAK